MRIFFVFLTLLIGSVLAEALNHTLDAGLVSERWISEIWLGFNMLLSVILLHVLGVFR